MQIKRSLNIQWQMLPLILMLGTSLANAYTTQVNKPGVSAPVQANLQSLNPSTSDDGRFTAYESDATQLAPNDLDGIRDIFLYDHQTKTNVRISEQLDGTGGTSTSLNPVVSGNGEYVVFESNATNLIANDTNSTKDIFLYAIATQSITRVSTNAVDIQTTGSSNSPDISADGRYVVFESNDTNLVTGDTNNQKDIFRHDTTTGITTRISVDSTGTEADLASLEARISADGNFVSFTSHATNLVATDSNAVEDIFLHDITTGATTRVSINNLGNEGNGSSDASAISQDGSVITFSSSAANLVIGDTNGVSDIFAHSTTLNATLRVSVNTAGTQGNSSSYLSDVSNNGHLITFYSAADNLVASDTNASDDIFIRDIFNTTTIRVSLHSDGTEGNANSEYPKISGNGQFIIFSSAASNLVEKDTNLVSDIFLHAVTGETSRINQDYSDLQANNSLSSSPALSADGRYIAFTSWASNLVADDTNNASDIFLYDKLQHSNRQISLTTTGESPAWGNSSHPSVSGDGRYIAFGSYATSLVVGDSNGEWDVFVFDTLTEITSLISVDSFGNQSNDYSGYPVISADGQYVVFESDATNLVTGDINGSADIFLHHLTTGETTRVSVDSNQVEGNSDSGEPAISSDGRYIVFSSDANNLIGGDNNNEFDIFLRDTQSETTSLISVDSNGLIGNGYNESPAISADGTLIVFVSGSDNLVLNDTNTTGDVFLHDTTTGDTTRISVDSTGTEGNASSGWPKISQGGEFVVFDSTATNLVSADTNGVKDIFMHSRLTNITTRISVNSDGSEAISGQSTNASVSADGRNVVYQSSASNLAPSEINGRTNIYLYQDLIATAIQIDSHTPAPSAPGQGLTISYSLTGGTPSGDVTVTADSGESCTSSVAAGSCELTFNDLGNHELTAEYAGDENYAPSTSVTVNHNVESIPDSDGDGLLDNVDNDFCATKTLHINGGTNYSGIGNTALSSNISIDTNTSGTVLVLAPHTLVLKSPEVLIKEGITFSVAAGGMFVIAPQDDSCIP